MCGAEVDDERDRVSRAAVGKGVQDYGRFAFGIAIVADEGGEDFVRGVDVGFSDHAGQCGADEQQGCVRVLLLVGVGVLGDVFTRSAEPGAYDYQLGCTGVGSPGGGVGRAVDGDEVVEFGERGERCVGSHCEMRASRMISGRGATIVSRDAGQYIERSLGVSHRTAVRNSFCRVSCDEQHKLMRSSANPSG